MKESCGVYVILILYCTLSFGNENKKLIDWLIDLTFPVIFWWFSNWFFFVYLGIVEPMSTGQSANDYMTRTVNPTLLKGLTELCKMKPKEPIVSTM